MPIIITSKIERFRRAGIAHTKAPVEYADDAFTDAQWAQLHKEPNLTLELIDKLQPLSELSLKELRKKAVDSGVQRASKMNTTELIAALTENPVALKG